MVDPLCVVTLGGKVAHIVLPKITNHRIIFVNRFLESSQLNSQ